MAKRLTKGKSNLPVSRSGVESSEANSNPIGHKRTNNRADVRVTQPTRTCECGCGEPLIHAKPYQRFVLDHRFTSYQSHACPSCGSTHRIAVKHGSVGDDPRDSSIDVVREQRTAVPDLLEALLYIADRTTDEHLENVANKAIDKAMRVQP